MDMGDWNEIYRIAEEFDRKVMERKDEALELVEDIEKMKNRIVNEHKESVGLKIGVEGLCLRLLMAYLLQKNEIGLPYKVYVKKYNKEVHINLKTKKIVSGEDCYFWDYPFVEELISNLPIRPEEKEWLKDTYVYLLSNKEKDPKIIVKVPLEISKIELTNYKIIRWRFSSEGKEKVKFAKEILIDGSQVVVQIKGKMVTVDTTKYQIDQESIQAIKKKASYLLELYEKKIENLKELKKCLSELVLLYGY